MNKVNEKIEELNVKLNTLNIKQKNKKYAFFVTRY